jgi:WD40 repeat protein
VIVTTRLPEEWRKTEQGQEVQSWAGRVALLDARTGAVSQQLEAEGLPYHSPCFSPDGRITAAVRDSVFVSRAEAKTRPEKRAGQVRLWDVASGRLQITLHLSPGEKVRGIIFDPDSKTLAISYSTTDPSTKTQRNMVKLWDVAKNKTLAELPNQEDVRFVAGGRYLVGQRRKDRQGQILLYDRVTKEDRRVFTYNIPKQVPYGASSWGHVLGAADSRFLLCCFHDGRVVKLDLPSGKVVAEQKATIKDRGFYSGWSLSDDGRFLAGNVPTRSASWRRFGPGSSRATPRSQPRTRRQRRRPSRKSEEFR